MKILIVLPDRMVGGAQILALRLAAALALRHQVAVMYACPEEAGTTPPSIPVGVTLLDSAPGHWKHYVPALVWFVLVALDFVLPPWRWGRETGFLLRLANRMYQPVRRRQFLRTVRDSDFDVINSHTWRADYFLANSLPEAWRTPWVITMHGCYEMQLADLKRHPELGPQMRKILNRADQVLYTAEKNRLVVSQVPGIQLKRAMLRVDNGFDLEALAAGIDPPKAPSGAGLRLVLVSRAIPEKGWEEAIHAVQQLNAEENLGIHLVLVGEGDHQRYLQKKYIDPHIKFYGHSANPAEVISGCHIGLLPSYFAAESYPSSVIEYLVCGKPVIATDIGEIGSMIAYDSGRAGQLIPLGASGRADIQALKQAILRYIRLPGVLEADSRLAQEAAKKFSMTKVVATYENIFRQCLERAN